MPFIPPFAPSVSNRVKKTGDTMTGELILNIPLAIGSGGIGLGSLGSANNLLTVNATETAFSYRALAGDNGITFLYSASTITLSLPQQIYTTSVPIFAGADLRGATIIDGSANAIQLIVQGNATQTTDLAVFENSSGTDVVGIRDNVVNNDFASNFLSVVGTLPDPTTQSVTGARFDITTQGTGSAVNRFGVAVRLLSGFTGTGSTSAMQGANSVAGTGNNLNITTAAAPSGNSGLSAQATATTTGLNNAGFYGVQGGNLNIAVLAKAPVAKASATNVGVLGVGRNTNATSPIMLGGWFTTANVTPTWESVALAADNGDREINIFLLKDNGTDVVKTEDGGNTTFFSRLMTDKGADVASGSTITLGSDGNYFDITGTTTINHITTTGWNNGAVIILQFDGSVTVTHNAAAPPANTAAILLSGSANFSATANDTLGLVWDGVAFREIFRTVI